MILIVGIPSDPPLALALAAAERAGVPVAVVDQRDCAAASIVLRLDGDGPPRGDISTRQGIVALDEVRGVYVRLDDPECLSVAAAAKPRLRAFHGMLNDWLEITPARVLNRTAPSAGNASKPAQARRLAALGWTVPATLVTSDPAAVAAFRARHGRIVFKSASGIRSIVTEFTDQDEARLWRLRTLPAQFQALVEGTDIRVHVVGEQVFATEAKTSALDYRYGGRSGSPARLSATTLPEGVAARCVATAAALDLPLCGIDLRRRPDGSYVAFEANPSPAYSWYEESTGQAISDAIIAWLVAGDLPVSASPETVPCWSPP
jgi:hypothetical protein